MKNLGIGLGQIPNLILLKIIFYIKNKKKSYGINYNSLKNKITPKKYKISKVIGRGSFGCVFEGFYLLDKSKVTIKVENKNSHLLQLEIKFLSILKGYGILK